MIIFKCGRKYFSERIERAIRKNDLKTISKLLEGNNPAVIKDHQGNTLLHLTIKVNNCEMVLYFISIGCDVNAQNRMGTTPFLAALEARDLSMMKILWQNKANIFISDYRRMNVLKIILKFDGDVNREDFIDFLIEPIKASGLNAKELALLMLEAGWPIHYAIFNKNSEVLKFMLEAGCDVNSRAKETRYCTALHRAIHYCDEKSTQILLEYGADLDIHHEDVVHSPFNLVVLYICDKNFDIFETFLKHKPTLERFNTDGGIESYRYFEIADKSKIRLLLKYKVSLTKKDRSGYTLLQFLAMNKDPEIINLIMTSEIDANITDIYGNTPLHTLALYPNIEILKALINKGADVNVKNELGETPLFVAICYPTETRAGQEIIDILVENTTHLDEETQNIFLNQIVKENIPISDISSILKRLAIMHFQLEALSKRNFDIIENNSNINSTFSFYLQELDSMKQNQIINSSFISVLDILLAPEQKLLNLARNNEIVDNFFEIDFDSRYTIFGEVVKKRFKSAHSKQSLLQNAFNFLTKNIEQLNFNIDITENVVKFLSLDDLVTFDAKERF